MDFYEAWRYLNEHGIFKDIYGEGQFHQCLTIDVVKVDPINNKIESDETLNTKTQVWLECGQFNDEYANHDIDLDCGKDSFEEAIIELARLVAEKYGL